MVSRAGSSAPREQGDGVGKDSTMIEEQGKKGKKLPHVESSHELWSVNPTLEQEGVDDQVAASTVEMKLKKTPLNSRTL